MKEKRDEMVCKGAIYEPTGEVLSAGFRKEWRGYTFDCDDIQRLIKGEEIRITLDTGDPVVGLLVKESRDWVFREGIPLRTLNHVWSKEERKALYRGAKVICQDFWDTKKACHFTAAARWSGDEILLSVDQKELKR